jgi:uncharacterized membrane protein YqjE
MPGGTQDEDGVMNSLRRMAASVVGLARTRVELFAIELQEEKLRAITLLLWLSLGLVLAMAGVLVAIGGLALWLWQRAGYLGLAGLAGGTLVVAGIIFACIRLQLIRGPLPFAGTVDEFKKDGASLSQPE